MQLSCRSELPADIISDIFYVATIVDPPMNKLAYPPQGMSIPGRRKKMPPTIISLGWIRLTHICRQWRNVGIDLAPLWAGVLCAFPTAYEVFISRARDAPLCFDFRFAGSEHLRDYAVSNLYNIRSIIDFGHVNGLFWVKKLAGRSLPHLRALELILDDTKERYASNEDHRATLHAPVLQSLTLSHGLFLPFTSPSLTTLNLSAPDHRHASGVVTMPYLLTFLSSMPLLVSIHLAHFLGYSEPGSEEVSGDFSISLSRLHTFYYEGHDAQFVALWRSLSVPLDTSFTVRLCKLRKDVINAVIRSLSQHLRNPLSNTLFIRDIDYWQYDTEVTLAGEASGSPRVSIQPYHLNGIDERKPEHVCSLLKRIRPHLHSSGLGISSIHFKGAFRFEESPLAERASRVLDALRQLSAVTQVHIEQMDALLLAALGTKDDGLVFPTLRTITMRFEGEEWGWSGPGLHGIWDLLLSTLKARSEGSHHLLPRLILVGTRPTESLLMKKDEAYVSQAHEVVEVLLDQRTQASDEVRTADARREERKSSTLFESRSASRVVLSA